ncbi:hypothetical protein [Gluconobacter sp. OJB]|uniref:phage fiber-tail adaptor protein n=1 Tax=Gluconobacter sp. OJB TaxID=3145196 RepID=UPI0031F90290
MTTVNNLAPSPLRTIVLQGRNGTISQVVLCPKASADCLDYVLDFSTLLAGTGDTLTAIRSAVVTTATGGAYDLKVMWSAVAGPLVVAFLASGQPDTTQKILFEITTQQGRVYSVMAVLQITALTVATAPPSDFTADTLTNGKVLIAGIEALPSGYSANGRVVMATENTAPVGTPSFESVTAGTYSGDGSGLDVTSGGKVQTIGQWIAALSSGGAQGVGIKGINVTQGTVVAGQSSTVTLTATLTDGTTTAPATFEVPPGATGTEAKLSAAAINTALGYTAANGAEYFPRSIDNKKDSSGNYNLPELKKLLSGFDNSGGIYTISDPDTSNGNGGTVKNPFLQIGAYNGYFGTNFYVIKSLTNNPPGILLTNSTGEELQVTGFYDTSGNSYFMSIGFALNGRYASDENDNGCFAFVNPDNKAARYWKVQASTNTSGPFSPDLKISAGTSDLSAWQTPLVTFNGATNTAKYANEPIVAATYTFATLPTSPIAWQRALVTDKAIGSGSPGVMAMWNPNTKAWTGLSGEALV